jgi:alpha-methylacyl-CoA racemase
LEQAFLARSRDEWAGIFEQTDGCVAPVLDLEEAASHPHNKARGTFRTEGKSVQAAPAPRFSRTVTSIPASASVSGADWGSVLTDAGFELHEIEALQRSGAVL